MEQYNTLKWQTIEKGIGLLTLNRPQNYNAVDGEMIDELERFWAARMNDDDTVVILLNGEGKGFCAGVDLKWSMQGIQEKAGNVVEYYRVQYRLARINLAMRRCPQPIISLVHGTAAGEGFSFALASDIRVISKDSRFCAAYVNIGLGGADMSCSYFLPRLIGAGRAYELMYTANFLSAEEAYGLGLVSRVVERDQLVETGLGIARVMMTKNHMGLRLTKEAINMNIDAGGLEQALAMEDRNQVLLMLASGIKSSI